MTYQPEDYFSRAIGAHLTSDQFKTLQDTTVLLGGVGGGSNVAELLVRKGFGKFIIADLDVYEPHNIRQRGSTFSTLGVEKVEAMKERLLDVNPHVEVTTVPEGVTPENAPGLVEQSDVIVDLIDLHALDAKAVMHQAARRFGKYVVTCPSVINGAVLWVFAPDGEITFEEFFDYDPDVPMSETAWRHLLRAIPTFPSPELKELYRQAAQGTRSIPLDAVGVDQASVLIVSALENIVFERWENVISVPRGIQVDVSRPELGCQIVEPRLAIAGQSR